MSEIIGRSSGAKVAAGSAVRLHFSLLLPNGQEVDSTRNGEPPEFTMGDGNLLPGFEQALLGMRAGDAAQIAIPAADAFGERNPANVQIIARDRFAGIELEEGLIVSFAAPDGELPGVVVRLFDETVEVDFNHPLAGQDIVFDVAILEVQPAAD